MTARNFARDPRVLVHLDGGAEAIVLEGEVDRPAPGGVPAEVVDAYEDKYGWRLDPADEGMPYFRLRPSTARALRADDVRGSAVRWSFDA